MLFGWVIPLTDTFERRRLRVLLSPLRSEKVAASPSLMLACNSLHRTCRRSGKAILTYLRNMHPRKNCKMADGGQGDFPFQHIATPALASPRGDHPSLVTPFVLAQACSWAAEAGHRPRLEVRESVHFTPLYEEKVVRSQTALTSSGAPNRFYCYQRRDLDGETTPLARLRSGSGMEGVSKGAFFLQVQGGACDKFGCNCSTCAGLEWAEAGSLRRKRCKGHEALSL